MGEQRLVNRRRLLGFLGAGWGLSVLRCTTLERVAAGDSASAAAAEQPSVLGKPQLEIVGAPQERGRQLGEAYRSVADPYAKYGPPRDPQRARTWRRLRDNMLKFLTEHHATLVEEMEGMAAGLGVAFEDVLTRHTFNALSPILPALSQAGCTSIGLGASDDGPLLGKTLDGGAAAPDLARCTPICAARAATMTGLVVRPREGYDVLCWNGGPSLFTESGLNARGLCVGANSGRPVFAGQDGRGMPQHLIMRYSLIHCATVPEAIDFVRAIPLAGKGINLVFVDAEGRSATLENCADGHAVHDAVRGVSFSTNHYVDAKMFQRGLQAAPDYLASPHFQNSVNRWCYLERRLRKEAPARFSFAFLKALLSDGRNPGAVCQHPGNNDANWLTTMGMICVSHRRELWLSQGIPCSSPWARYRLAEKG